MILSAGLVLLVVGAWRVAVSAGAAPGPERVAAVLSLAVAEAAVAARLSALFFDASAPTVAVAAALIGAGSWWWAGTTARTPGLPRFAIGAETGQALIVAAGGVVTALVCGSGRGALDATVDAAGRAVAAGRPPLFGADAIGAFAAGRWAVVGAVGAGRPVALVLVGCAAAAAALALVSDWRWALLVTVVLVVDLDRGGLLATVATVAIAAGAASVWLARLRDVRPLPAPTRARPRGEASPVPPARPRRVVVRRDQRAAIWGLFWVGVVALAASPVAPVLAVVLVVAGRPAARVPAGVRRGDPQLTS